MDFVPRDLDVSGFVDSMNQAVCEHIQSRRLLLCDTESIKFGPEGSFESLPLVDEQAEQLFNEDFKKYMKLQVDKLTENLLNRRVATKLLTHRETVRDFS